MKKAIRAIRAMKAIQGNSGNQSNQGNQDNQNNLNYNKFKLSVNLDLPSLSDDLVYSYTRTKGIVRKVLLLWLFLVSEMK